MFAVARTSLLRRLSSLQITTSGGPCRLSHDGPVGPVYELRIYNFKPDKFGTIRQLMADKFHLRLSYSRPLGYWLTELGGIFQAVHIWPYESVSHRAEIRAALAKDRAWNEEFLPTFTACATRLDNTLTVLAPGSSLCTDFEPSPTAVYELASQPGTEDSRPGSGAETLVGRFHTVYGDTNTEYRLTRYPDADTAFTFARKRIETPKNKVVGYSRFMIPHDVSPLK